MNEEAIKMNIRLACVMEAIKLKTSEITAKDYKDETVTTVAEKLSNFVFNK